MVVGNGANKGERLILVGGNYRTMVIEERERLSLCKADVPYTLHSLRSIDGLNEVVFLSTCNRAEIYAVVNGTDEFAIIEFLHRQHNIPRRKLQSSLYVATDKGACTHLFRVAAGLDSMIVGEPQILKQVKEAYELAMRLKCCGVKLSQLFMRALSVGKRVRTETRICDGSISIPHAAIHMAERILGKFDNLTLLLIGAGEMGMLTLRLFKKRGIGKVVIANRTVERAEQLAAQFDAVAISLDELQRWLPLADIVVSCTDSPNHVLISETVSDALEKRTGSSERLLIIDLAVPRDIDPDVGRLPKVKLLNIDELVEISEEYRKLREQEAMRAEAIIHEEAEEFWKWWRAKQIEPLIVKVLVAAEKMRAATLNKFAGKLASCGDKERKAIDLLTRRLMKRLLHPLIEHIRMLAANGDNGVEAEACIKLLQRISDWQSRKEVGE